MASGIDKNRASRLKELIRDAKKNELISTQKDLAEKLNITEAMLSILVNGGMPDKLPMFLDGIEELFGGRFSRAYLEYGEGNLYASAHELSIEPAELSEQEQRAERMKEAMQELKSLGLASTITEAADIMEVSRTQLSNLIGGRPRYFTEGQLTRFNRAFGDIFNLDYLRHGTGTLLAKSPQRVVLGYNEVEQVDHDDYVFVEVVDLEASAGRLGGGNVDILPDGKRRLLPKEYGDGSYLVVRISGDSMDDGTSRSLRNGYEVLCREVYQDGWEELPIHKHLFIITTRDGNVLKQISEVKRGEDGYIVCHSYNERYKDFKIYLSDVLQFFVVHNVVYSPISLL